MPCDRARRATGPDRRRNRIRRLGARSVPVSPGRFGWLLTCSFEVRPPAGLLGTRGRTGQFARERRLGLRPSLSLGMGSPFAWAWKGGRCDGDMRSHSSRRGERLSEVSPPLASRSNSPRFSKVATPAESIIPTGVPTCAGSTTWIGRAHAPTHLASPNARRAIGPAHVPRSRPPPGPRPSRPDVSCSRPCGLGTVKRREKRPTGESKLLRQDRTAVEFDGPACNALCDHLGLERDCGRPGAIGACPLQRAKIGPRRPAAISRAALPSDNTERTINCVHTTSGLSFPKPRAG